MVAILALPRSGTTMITAILSVHSHVIALYEPWNAHKTSINARESMNFDRFAQTFVPDSNRKSVLVTKETATDPNYIARMSEILETAPASIECHLIIPFRNPFHVFLSEVQARREWWGVTDLQVGPDAFSLWARRTVHSLRLLATLAAKNDTLLLSYERFARDPSLIDDLTLAIGLIPEPNQHEFQNHLNQSAVRGDLNVARAPRKLTTASVEQRAEELESVRQLIANTPEYPIIAQIAELTAELPALSWASQNSALIEQFSALKLS